MWTTLSDVGGDSDPAVVITQKHKDPIVLFAA